MTGPRQPQTCSLEPAAIRLTLKRLQESARRSGCFLLVNFMYTYPRNSRE